MQIIHIKSVRRAALIEAALLLSACANLAGPRDVSIPLSKLQAGVERKFPLKNKAMEMLDVQLSHPRLSLLDADRVGLALDIAVAPPFIKQSWRGSMALSGRLSVDLQRSAIFLVDPHLDRVDIDGVDRDRQQQFGILANAVLNRSVRDVALYNFRLEDLRYAGVQFLPTGIRTTPDAIVIHLEAQK